MLFHESGQLRFPIVTFSGSTVTGASGYSGIPCAHDGCDRRKIDLSLTTVACCSADVLRQASMKHSGFLGVGIGALAVCAASCGASHPGGDPGGRIFGALTSVQ